jgi:hypothetical protein
MAHNRTAPRQQQCLRHVLFDRHIGRQRFECLRLGPEAAGQDHVHWQLPERIQRHGKLGGGVEKGSQGQIDGSLIRQRDDALGQHVTRLEPTCFRTDRDHVGERLIIGWLQDGRKGVDVGRVGHGYAPRRITQSRPDTVQTQLRESDEVRIVGAQPVQNVKISWDVRSA